VAILWPEDSINFYGKPEVLHTDFTQSGQKGETVGDIHEEFNGFYDALVKNVVPCDVIDEESVRSEDIGKYDLLILPNVACIGHAFDDNLRSYVNNGGNVIASFETSICDENGNRGQNLALADLFGIRMLRTSLRPYPHFYFFRTAVYLAGVFGGQYRKYKQLDIRLLLRNLFYQRSALEAAKLPNIWFCLCGPHLRAMEMFCQRVDSNRILWGSDFGFGFADSIEYRLGLIRRAKIEDSRREQILGQNPLRLIEQSSI